MATCEPLCQLGGTEALSFGSRLGLGLAESSLVVYGLPFTAHYHWAIYTETLNSHTDFEKCCLNEACFNLLISPGVLDVKLHWAQRVALLANDILQSVCLILSSRLGILNLPAPPWETI